MPDNHCFHCGLPTQEKNPPVSEVFCGQQVFCCRGCKAVCNAIVSSGNADYYKYRDSKATTVDEKTLPVLLEKLALYDKPEIQRDFVRNGLSNERPWKEAWLIIEEIRCAACLWLNEQTLRALVGVIDVQMDYTGQQARIRWDPELVKLSEILTAITNIGYIAHPFDPAHREALNQEQTQHSLKRLIFALILGMMVMQTAVSSYLYGAADDNGEYPLWIVISRWSSLFSTALILVYPGQLFFRNAWRDLKNKTLGMDVPVVIGLSVAWFGSLYSILTSKGHVYFESIAMFVIFLLFARYLELRARIAATALLDRSFMIIPSTAKLIIDDTTKEIAVIDLQPRDRIQVSPGETVPVDGTLLSRDSSFDESLLTGEGIPLKRKKGDLVLGGSINIDQVIEIEVLQTTNNSTLNKFHLLTQESINSRPHYVNLADRVAGKFVAVILLLAATTFIYWSTIDPGNAVSHMVSVLIVTCPCALALAAPVTLSLTAAALSSRHTLAVRLSAIEKWRHIDLVVFDKTGTLTAGNPVLSSIDCIGSEDEKTCLNLAAIMEEGSHHPFARAIVAACSASNRGTIPVKDIKHLPGEGIEAFVDNDLWKIGSETFCSSAKYKLTPQLDKSIQSWRNQGNSTIFMSNSSGMQAIFYVHDPVRKGLDSFISYLNQSGLHRQVILSGDHQNSVSALASLTGIKEYYGDMSPYKKLEWIKAQQHQGRKILMLGDGINDAPTLAAADLSVSFSDATDLAQRNSDLILLNRDFRYLGRAFKIMCHSRIIILQNLGWALTYNFLAVPAAMMGLVTPWMAAIGMTLSSILVVLNSLRMKHQIADSAWPLRNK